MTPAGRALCAPASAPASARPTTGIWRWARGGAVGLSATALALAGHVLGGGGQPAPAQIGLLTLVAAAGSVALSGQRWTLGPLLGVLIGVQIGFHVAFGQHSDPLPSGPGVHVHGALAHPAMAGHGPGWRMLAGHALAAALTALLLRRGEAWCWRLAELLARPARALRLLTLPDPLPGRRVLLGRGRATAMRSRLLVCAQPRRGPPQPLAS